METNPFALLARAVVASFEIAVHIGIGLFQTIWFVANGRKDKVGDAVGDMMKGISDAMVRMFHK
ncbi:MAG: hypothetical protein AUJ92_15365 [Armatimonadetes bacterium CG2_30_59_28]|nr:hypothetical protein [Armatimonadota bacterium]OIO91897.1 MAG: hypothetical protein AUJ92_15365 [Armatimonadetes bacterium CG2_30_59_28]PIU65494.1 MAG: hypothetical protein COS85_08615 [Armatimonadetes bacterium CG07_land_8_20_14_0_80_59_28]PIX44974.1 MAG: hypothetical protein COZ56_03160 [Armatimonadetes bacterium CG_4_8_14_3_um_filter_58_9]PJB78369.1 MAG: hypothetical protein CO095_00580 [Armatimonadetes bacterium CG_4_9_14_3_um_filter_58_7]